VKLAVAAGVLAAALAASVFSGARPVAAQVAPAPVHPAVVPVPIVLPHAPPPLGGTSSALFAAQLAIARAQAIDPHAAQNASFAYAVAVRQYRSGNFAGARISALQALSTASQVQVQPSVPAPVPAPALVPAAPQKPGLGGGLYGADAPVIDADSFLALARGTLDACSARHDRRFAAAQAHYARAEQDFALGNWEATRVDTRAAIDACAKAQP
jgi:hypothetical protein